MFEWLGNPDTAMPLLHALERRITFIGLSCVQCSNSNIASTSIMCTLRNAICAFRINMSKYALCRRVKTVLVDCRHIVSSYSHILLKKK